MTEFASADTIRPATTTAAGNERKRGIDRVIILLEALLRQRAPMRVGDIARKIGAPRSTTYEIVNRLLEADMLETVGNDGHVYFGRAMHLFGWAYSHHNAHYPRIIEALERLAAESGETVQLCGLRGNKYVVLDSRDSVGPFRISSQVGVEVPIPWTASGRLLLSHMDDDAVRAFIPAEDFRLPDGRVIAEAEFLGDIALAKQQGYSETAPLHLVPGGADPRRARPGLADAVLRAAGRYAGSPPRRPAGAIARERRRPRPDRRLAPRRRIASLPARRAHWPIRS